MRLNDLMAPPCFQVQTSLLCLGETVSNVYDMERQNFEVDGGSSCSFMSMEEIQTSTLNMFLCAADLFEELKIHKQLGSYLVGIG